MQTSYSKVSIFILLVIYSFSSFAANEDQFRVRGLSAFNHDHSQLLESWLTFGVNATRATLGVYPTPLSLYVYPRKSNQPVPWAYTKRNGKGSVHFHVDPRFGLKKFVDDWTIYHELAHMALPYLGSQYRWLSEGFASYMQYQIMAQADVLQGTLSTRYQSQIAKHLRWFKSDLTAASIAKRLMNNNQYPAAYWGSAYFFIYAEQLLEKKHQTSLVALISYYQDCCRQHDNNLADVFASLDGILEDNLFASLLNRFETEPARNLYPESFN